MIRPLLFLALLALSSCSNSSQESPAPPPEPAVTEAPLTPAPKTSEPAKPAPAKPRSTPGAADLAMAVNTTSDLILVTKKGFLTDDGVLIQGKVKNTTDKDFHFVEISFKLFDQDKKELALVRTTTDSLNAGRTWNFEIKAPYPKAVSSTLERLGGF